MTNELEPLESLSVDIDIAQLSEEAIERSIGVSADDRKAVARRLDVPAVVSLSGALRAVRHGSLVRVDGRIDAELERTCVVSLEPMTESISEDFAADYTIDPAEAGGDDLDIDLDAPEPLEGDVLDLGAVLLEQLVLAMNPHPRKEDAQAPNDPGAGKESSPFDVLKALKN
ncbi:MAG: YceD family protein [Pseudomonadota bacterium]